MQQVKEKLETLHKEVDDALAFLKLPEKEERLAELEEKMNEPGFWDDAQKAQKLSKEHGFLKQSIESWKKLKEDIAYDLDLLKVVSETSDEEEFKEIKESADKLQKRFESLEIELYLSGKYDTYPAILTFSAGAGGTDAQDFAEMLLRMYTRYAEAKEWKVELLDKSESDDAGIKSATLRLEGNNTFGFMKEESGVHRLVRLSPFNSGNTRETSFVKVEVTPEIEHNDVEIDEKDLRVDVFRSSGKGGQSVNTTDSAVRITHIPSGIVVQCQNERSQLQNKQNAMANLASKLVALQEKNELAELSEIRGDHVETAWGNQIRSYVMHPYQMVKDHRTDHETNQVDKVMSGDANEIDVFIERSLKSHSKK
jgi:peptide chain release factor 2